MFILTINSQCTPNPTRLPSGSHFIVTIWRSRAFWGDCTTEFGLAFPTVSYACSRWVSNTKGVVWFGWWWSGMMGCAESFSHTDLKNFKNCLRFFYVFFSFFPIEKHEKFKNEATSWEYGCDPVSDPLQPLRYPFARLEHQFRQK